MISITADHSEVKQEIRAKISGMRKVILGFADDESPLVSQIAKATIFNGQATSSLQVRSGATQKEGLLTKRVRSSGSKSNYAGEAYWSHMTNIFDNLKKRPKMKLLKSLKEEFEKDSRVQRIFDDAMKDFEAVK